MTIRYRHAFFFLLGIIFLCFLYAERSILSPLIVAAIFAYIFNPIITFFSEKIRLPRAVGVVIVFACIMAIITALGILLTSRGLDESSQLRKYMNDLPKTAQHQIVALPRWIQPTAHEFLLSLQKSKLFSPSLLFSGDSLLSLFPEAISRIVSFLIFLFSSFYFLKEGRNIFDGLLRLMPSKHTIEVDIVFRKINAVLNGYLRGQIFLVFLVSVILYIGLLILGVRFALIIAIFSGFAEIIPVIGPIVATIVAVLVVVVTGSTNFALNPISAALIIIIYYFIVRHVEDYFIIPHVMGKITKLHPFIIFLAVITGGHLWGILGLILAVPTAAILRILLEFSFDTLHTIDSQNKKEINSA